MSLVSFVIISVIFIEVTSIAIGISISSLLVFLHFLPYLMIFQSEVYHSSSHFPEV